MQIAENSNENTVAGQDVTAKYRQPTTHKVKIHVILVGIIKQIKYH
jgi:hypothetical protein